MVDFFDKVHRFLYKSALWIACLIMAIIFVMSFVFQSRVTMDGSEIISFHRNNALMYVFLAVCISVLWFIKEKIQQLDEKKLFHFCAAVYIGIGFVFILGLSGDLKGDAYTVTQQVVGDFIEGNYYFLQKGEYIARYPHQLGLVAYESILRIFSQNIKIYFCANLAFVLLNNWVTWKISCLLFPEKSLAHNLTIILSFLFLPQFFFIAFIYGTIPSFSMLLMASYFQIHYLKGEKIGCLVCSAVFASLSCILRSNNLIGVIALVIVFVLESVKKRKIKWILAAMVLVIGVSSGTKILNAYYEAKSGERIAYAEPKLLWIAMGLRDESSRLGGWYDGFNVNTFASVNYDVEKANEIAKVSIGESVKKFTESPGYAVKFFTKKSMSTWCDPLFQSLWSGPLRDCDQGMDDERLYALYDEGSYVHIITRQLCQALLIFMYGTALLFLIQELNNKSCDGYLFGFICFIGGVLFHLVWETKSQYVYPYVFAMIPYMSNAYESLCTQVKQIKRRNGIANGNNPEIK